jgi:hypothetical protein
MKRPVLNNRPVRWRLAAVLVLFLPLLAIAQETGAVAGTEPGIVADDPFAPGAFEAAAGDGAGTPASAHDIAMGAGISASGTGTGDGVTRNLVGGTLISSAGATTASGLSGYQAQAGLAGKLFAKAMSSDFGSLYIAYNLRYAYAQGMAGDTFNSLPGADLENASFALSELHYGFDIEKKIFIRAGKQLIAWGPSRIWSPVDFINRERADPFQSVDLRTGKPGLRLHMPFARANLFAFADFSQTVDSGITRDLARWTNLALRADAALAGAEFGITSYAGLETQARIGLDFSGRVQSFTIYGEAVWAPGYGSDDEQIAASFGFARALGDLKRWSLAGELYYDSRGSDRTGSYIPGNFVPLYSGMVYAYLALTAEELLSGRLSTTLSGIVNFSDSSSSIKIAGTLDPPRSPSFTLSLSWNGGGSGKEFTSLGGNDSLNLSLQSRLEF